jgi:Ca-activated chloride channel family protein
MLAMKKIGVGQWVAVGGAVILLGLLAFKSLGPRVNAAGTQSASDLAPGGGGPTDVPPGAYVLESQKVAASPAATMRGGGAAAKPAAVATGNDDVAPVAAALDPNARYATTYRPGGAALAAFDAAVSKGSLPGTYKDLVADFGGRYAPALGKPANGAALGFQIDTERAALPPAGGNVNLRIAIRSSDAMPERAQLSVHLVLDVSGSMQGAAIDNARKAAAVLVEKLQATDDFSLVTFSSEASVLVPDGAIGPRRAMALAKIKAIVAEGGTNISSGLDQGYGEARTATIHPDAVKIVILLSDGHANGGDSSPTGLWSRSERAFQDGIQTSAFGLGADFDAPLMSGIADKGAGGYYYLADSTQISAAIGRELDARLVPVAQAVEIRVRLRPDVTPVKVFGSHMLDGAEAAAVRRQEVVVDKLAAKKDGIKQDRKEDTEGGMRFFMPAFARDDHHAMLLTLAVPAGVDERALASVEVRYKDRLRKKNVTDEMPLKIKFAPSDAESAKSIDKSVAATAQAFAAGDSILAAAAQVDRGNRSGAARTLNERADLLKAASTQLGDARLNEDAHRMARLAAAIDGDGKVADPLPLAVLLRGSGYGYLR